MAGGFGGAMTADERVIDDHLDVQAIIRSYQVYSIGLGWAGGDKKGLQKE